MSSPNPAPPRVANVEAYWTDPPPERSARCAHWLGKISAGWRPGRRWRGAGYYARAELYGVYIWELFNVLEPHLLDEISKDP